MTLEEMLGQKLMIGIPGTELTAEDRDMIRQYNIANIILFKKNIRSREQLKNLCQDIQDCVSDQTGHPAFIGIDQEGGCVARLSKDALNVPGAMAIAAVGDVKNAKKAAVITARELHSLGVNFNFAPSVDINNNLDNPIIGSRSYGDTAEQVCAYACAALAGYKEENMLISAKHFPGHGDTGMDSHISLPMIDKSLDELEKLELIPFRAMIDSGCPSIMTTHILFPQIEPDRVPATMSRRIVTDLLKKRLGFGGLVISDSMEMGAIADYYGVSESSAAAFAAGVDIVMITHRQERAADVFEKCKAAVASGGISPDEMEQSACKILDYKKRYCSYPLPRFDRKRAQKTIKELYRKSMVLADGQIPPLGNAPFFLGCKDYRAGLISNDSSAQVTFAHFMAGEIGGDALVTADDPDAEEIAKAVNAASGHTSIIVCTYNGHVMKGQLALVDALSKTDIPMVHVALRDPYDFRADVSCAAKIAAWDYTDNALQCLVPILKGETIPAGKMPVRLR